MRCRCCYICILGGVRGVILYYRSPSIVWISSGKLYNMLRSRKAILDVATSNLQKWQDFSKSLGPCMPIWHPLMYMRIKRISRCQKRCSDGKPFYYIAHSDINNTLGNFLFKKDITTMIFFKKKALDICKIVIFFSESVFGFSISFILCSTTALLTTRTILKGDILYPDSSHITFE